MLHTQILHTTEAPLLPKLRGNFAEFLNEGFLARLRILTLPTCGGLRYGHQQASLEVFLDSVESATSLLKFTPHHNSDITRMVFPLRNPTCLDAHFQPCAWPILLCHPILQTAHGGIGFSTDYPSPTPLSLGLGPDLPWVDEPSPGNLRFSAGRILTCLYAYLYRHSHLYALHHSSQYSFNAHTTLPYQ